MPTTRKGFVIGLAGGTGAGKTTIARELSHRLRDACVVDLDSYYVDRSAVSPEQRALLNYDVPSAFDVSLLLDHLRELAAGRMVGKPTYSFDTHTRTGIQSLSASPIIIVEGHLTLWWEDLRALLDLKVFVDAPADVRLTRRTQRDLLERARTVESVLAQYLGTVRPMHERYVEPSRKHADLIVVNDGSFEKCADILIAAIEALAIGRR